MATDIVYNPGAEAAVSLRMELQQIKRTRYPDAYYRIIALKIDPVIKRKVIQGLIEAFRKTPNAFRPHGHLARYSRERYRHKERYVAEMLNSALDWESSAQGFAFWSEIFTYLAFPRPFDCLSL